MLLSQIALLVLITLGIALGYVPLRLGMVVLVVWVLSKLIMRRIIKQVEEVELRRNRMGGAQIALHSAVPVTEQELFLEGVESQSSRVHYWLDVTVTPPSEDILWKPLDLTALCGSSSANSDAKPCLIAIRSMSSDGIPGQLIAEEVRGPLRLRLLVELAPDARECLVTYRQESLGTIELPS